MSARRPKHDAAAPARTARTAHRVRIVGGAWKRTPLLVPDVPGLRPTPDRVRETLFNWLGASLEGRRCLDLYAGTGALGLEAASRGAAQVVLVERDRRALQALRTTVERLAGARERVRIVEGDALGVLRALARTGERFGGVFLDPPFRAGWLERLWPELGAVLDDDAWVYAESEQALPERIALAGPGERTLHRVRADKAGQVHYHLLRCHNAPAAGGDRS